MNAAEIRGRAEKAAREVTKELNGISAERVFVLLTAGNPELTELLTDKIQEAFTKGTGIVPIKSVRTIYGIAKAARDGDGNYQAFTHGPVRTVAELLNYLPDEKGDVIVRMVVEEGSEPIKTALYEFDGDWWKKIEGAE